MCKNWIETRFCRYKNKCQFAHGGDELIQGQEPEIKNYKSKECKSFHENYFCPYGSRCKFIHEARSLEEVHEFYYVTKVQQMQKQSFLQFSSYDKLKAKL